MDVRRTKRHFDLRGSGVRQQQTEKGIEHQTHNGNFGLRNVEGPQSVQAGDQFSVSFEVFNGFVSSSQLFPTNPDSCENNANPCDGTFLDVAPVCYEASISATGGGSDTTGPTCLAGSPATVKTDQHSLSADAPSSEGTYQVEVTLEHPGSGTTRTGTFGLSVVEGGGEGCATDAGCPGDQVCNDHGICVSPEGCTNDTDCGSDQICDNGTCVPEDGGGGPLLPCIVDPNNECGQMEIFGYGAAALLLLLAIVGLST